MRDEFTPDDVFVPSRVFAHSAPRMSRASARDVLDWMRDHGLIRLWVWDPDYRALTIYFAMTAPNDEDPVRLSVSASTLERATEFALEQMFDQRWRKFLGN